jgi:hypothetical protein
MLMDKIWDGDYMATVATFYRVMKEPQKLMEYYDRFTQVRELKAGGKWDSLGNEEKARFDQAVEYISSVRSVLNDRELIAIGIREGTYDEVIFRRWWYSTFMQEWRASSALVARIRGDTQAAASQYAYRDMEALARRWEAEGPWTPREKYYQLPGGRVLTIHRSR